MRSLARWIQSNRGCWLLIGVTLFLYLLIFQPLDRRAEDRERVVKKNWNELAKLHQKTLDPERRRLIDISQGLDRLDQTVDLLPDLLAGLSIDPNYQNRALTPFKLVEYQADRNNAIAAVEKTAKNKKVKIEPEVFEAFPIHRSNQPRPHLLWAELALSQQLLLCMIQASVESISELSIEPRTDTGDDPMQLKPLTLEVTFSCSSPALSRLLVMLPLNSETIRERLELPDYPEHKPSLFVDRILIRKNSTEKPSQVGVWMKIVGFVPPDMDRDAPLVD